MGWMARRCRHDAGQTTVEWLGICAVIVAIILAVVAAAGRLGEQIQAAAETEICRAVGDPGCGGGASSDQDVAAAGDGDGADGSSAAEEGSGAGDPAAGSGGPQGGADGSAGGDGANGGDGGEDGDGGGEGGDGGGEDGDDGGEDGGGGGGILDRIGGAIDAGLDAGGDIAGAVGDGLRTAGTAALDGGSALVNGFVLGDYGDGYDNPWLEGIRILGQTGSGILIIGDVRDGVRAIQEGDEASLGLIAIGLVPIYGDTIRAGGNVADSVVDATRAADDVAAAAPDAGRAVDDVADGADDVTPGRGTDPFCSFSADTRVLLASGRAVPIAEVQVGDVVLAGDPAGAGWQAQPVTHLWVHADVLVDLVTSAGRITTTADHPFWNATDEAWQAAGELDPGDALLAPDGGRVAVIGLDHATAHLGTAHNLSVAGPHTYVVRAGDHDVLVHNQNTCDLTTPERRDHILHGEQLPNGAHSGGHLWPGRPGKSPFPEGWDADRVIHEISDVATDPSSTRQVQGNGRIRVEGTRDGVDIRVILEPDGTIVTGHPTNIPPNPP